MKSRKPSLLSNSGPPRRAAALPKRPNCILLTPPWPAARVFPLSRTLPAEPVDDRMPHHEILVETLKPRQFLGEHRHALPIRAWHAGDVGAPKAALRAERVIDLADVFVNVAIGVGFARIARRARELDRDIREFGERQHLAQISKGGIVLPGATPTAAAMVIDVQFQPGVALGDPAELGHMSARHQADWQLLPLAGRPEPTNGAVRPPALLMRLVERKAKSEHARPLPPILNDLLFVPGLQVENAEDAEFARICL